MGPVEVGEGRGEKRSTRVTNVAHDEDKWGKRGKSGTDEFEGRDMDVYLSEGLYGFHLALNLPDQFPRRHPRDSTGFSIWAHKTTLDMILSSEDLSPARLRVSKGSEKWPEVEALLSFRCFEPTKMAPLSRLLSGPLRCFFATRGCPRNDTIQNRETPSNWLTIASNSKNGL